MHKKLFGSLGRKESDGGTEKGIPSGDGPEAVIVREVRAFCESGGPNNAGEEVLHLPAIVDAAESSPRAAAQAAAEIRKFLTWKNNTKAYLQYNAIMLIRILTENPGHTFTQNIDSKFVTTVKELLREGRDGSVQQILRETLDSFEKERTSDQTLMGLRDMWTREKQKEQKRSATNNHFVTQPAKQQPPSWNANNPNYFTHSHKGRGLPSPEELSQRVEEARTSAKLLSQLVQSTPPEEVLGNELIKEFADRCQTASRSMQVYINSTDPHPDEDTLLTLIETNDQLSASMSRHQRAMLQARKAAGLSGGNSPNPPITIHQQGPFEAPGDAPPSAFASQGALQTGTTAESYTPPAGPPPGTTAGAKPAVEAHTANPFGDHAASNTSRGADGLQAPLVPQTQAQTYGLPPQTYGLPPIGIDVPTGGIGMAIEGGIEEPRPQDNTQVEKGYTEQQQQEGERSKPRYRF